MEERVRNVAERVWRTLQCLKLQLEHSQLGTCLPTVHIYPREGMISASKLYPSDLYNLQ